ncbi:hypothetical protein CIHG_05727 [Coccidioides immitis H538.4]|uniref:Uncharacterized protein n=3 Tax=Coccidioides immitis TaxID=5501 RepID=A0A0J8R258_COCIT|nr:hypothetical protein CIRG_08509 [Coccidioides immitis RMSCC 2394]KMU78826.1 hypothetical protein CISG_01866 [Coccidioides immitis RMSCC 3703]KMU87960.1 hypothetical protein CIHG_05727 [Coccidioides immitis H538.4]
MPMMNFSNEEMQDFLVTILRTILKRLAMQIQQLPPSQDDRPTSNSAPIQADRARGLAKLVLRAKLGMKSGHSSIISSCVGSFGNFLSMQVDVSRSKDLASRALPPVVPSRRAAVEEPSADAKPPSRSMVGYPLADPDYRSTTHTRPSPGLDCCYIPKHVNSL